MNTFKFLKSERVMSNGTGITNGQILFTDYKAIEKVLSFKMPNEEIAKAFYTEKTFTASAEKGNTYLLEDQCPDFSLVMPKPEISHSPCMPSSIITEDYKDGEKLLARLYFSKDQKTEEIINAVFIQERYHATITACGFLLYSQTEDPNNPIIIKNFNDEIVGIVMPCVFKSNDEEKHPVVNDLIQAGKVV